MKGLLLQLKIFVIARQNRAPFLNLEFATFEFGGRSMVLITPARRERIRVLQIARLEAFSEPAVDRSEKFASLVRPANAAKVDPDLIGGEVMCEAKASAPASRV
jgi:hypothetical protein